MVMGAQRTFASLAWHAKGKVTRRERFLAELEAVIPWAQLLRLIEPHYPKAGKGRQPLGLEKLLRIYFLQQWFNLSDPQAEDAIYDSESMRRFARVELGDDAVPDETTILRFRHLLEQHDLTCAIFEAIGGLLEARGLLLRAGTIVDATIIAAPSSTKNATATRDPEMKQTRKGRNWHFGMKLHIGADKHGMVHTVRATNAAVADITPLPELLHGQEREVFGDQAYWKEDDRQFLESWGIRYRINRRPTASRPLTERWRMINRARSRTRACGEHPFRVVKQLWGFTKVRYRGLAKNLARAQAMFALANLYQVRHQLLPAGARCSLCPG
jgi:transposase, IS5 family